MRRAGEEAQWAARGGRGTGCGGQGRGMVGEAGGTVGRARGKGGRTKWGGWLFTEAVIEVPAVCAGDGYYCGADAGAVLADLVDLVDGQGIGAMDAVESVGR